MTADAVAGAELEVSGLTKSYYALRALDEVTFSVAGGELVGLIGPNGSGKTTAIDCISGLQRPNGGAIIVDGRATNGMAPNRLARHHVIRTFQDVRVFGTLSVRENLDVAAIGRLDRRKQTRALARSKRPSGEGDERIEQLIGTFGLEHVANLAAGELSYGQRKLVEFAAACVQPPRLLLLDEPVAAVNPTMAGVIADWVRELRDRGTTVLVVEHNMEFMVGLCDRLVVLDHGKKIADGDPHTVVHQPDVQEAYFGH